MNRLRIAVSAAVFLAGATCVLAQEEEKIVTPDQVEAKVNKDAKQAVADTSKAFVDPSLSSATRVPTLQALVSATRTDTSAAIEINLNSTAAAQSAFQAGLKLSGPIKKGASEANLATLEGLASQAKITFSLHWMNPRPELKFFNRDVFIKALTVEYKAEKPDGTEDPDELLMTDLTSKGQAKVLSDIGLGRGILLIGAEGTYAAPTTFEFANPDTLVAAKERHDGYSIAASFGWLPLRQAVPYFLGLTYRREEGYHDQDSHQLCKPFGVGGALDCADTVLGAPVKQVKNLGQFEARVYFHDGELALNPRISRDFANGITGVELPLYFLKDGNGVLNGGLALGWRSDKREVTLNAFVGSMKNPLAKKPN